MGALDAVGSGRPGIHRRNGDVRSGAHRADAHLIEGVGYCLKWALVGIHNYRDVSRPLVSQSSRYGASAATPTSATDGCVGHLAKCGRGNRIGNGNQRRRKSDGVVVDDFASLVRWVRLDFRAGMADMADA